MANFNQVFNIQTVTPSTKSLVPIKYQFQCIYCQSTDVFALTNDGGSVQMCYACKRIYRAKQVVCQQFR